MYNSLPSNYDAVSEAIEISENTTSYLQYMTNSLQRMEQVISALARKAARRYSRVQNALESAKRARGLASLPNELLRRIMELVPTLYDYRRISNVRRRQSELNIFTSLSLVCTRFQLVALSNPHFWNNITVSCFEISRPKAQETFSVMLKRSGALGAKVHIQSEGLDSRNLVDTLKTLMPGIVELNFEGHPDELQRALESISTGDDTQYHHLTSISVTNTQTHLHRTNAYSLQVPDLIHPQSLLNALIPLAPNCENLALKHFHPPKVLPSSVKQVRLASVDNGAALMLRGMSSYSAETPVTLDVQMIELWPSVKKLSSIVTWKMRTLTLEVGKFYYPLHLTRFPLLESLSVCFKIDRERASILESWRLFESIMTTMKPLDPEFDRELTWIDMRQKYIPKLFPKLRVISLNVIQWDDGFRSLSEIMKKTAKPHELLLSSILFEKCIALEHLEVRVDDPVVAEIRELGIPPQGLKTLSLANCVLGEPVIKTLQAYIGLGAGNGEGARKIENLDVVNCSVPPSETSLANDLMCLQ